MAARKRKYSEKEVVELCDETAHRIKNQDPIDIDSAINFVGRCTVLAMYYVDKYLDEDKLNVVHAKRYADLAYTLSETCVNMTNLKEIQNEIREKRNPSVKTEDHEEGI